VQVGCSCPSVLHTIDQLCSLRDFAYIRRSDPFQTLPEHDLVGISINSGGTRSYVASITLYDD
jgi:hypothetical protein